MGDDDDAAARDAGCWKCGGSGAVRGKRGAPKACAICAAARRRHDAAAGPDPALVARRRAVRVVVVGAGIGGCAVGLALGNLGFRVTVLERDESFAQRKQGYGLTIQQGWGALRRLGLEPPKMETPSYSHFAFAANGRILGYFGSAFSEWFAARDEFSAKRKGKFNGQGRFNSHVPRQHLRFMLLEPLADAGVDVRWGHRLVALRPSGKKTVEAVFARTEGQLLAHDARVLTQNEDDQLLAHDEDGRLPAHDRDVQQNRGDPDNRGEASLTEEVEFTIEADLVIGADGIFSSVRRELYGPYDRLDYLGCVVVLGIAPLRHALTHERVCETMDGETRLYTMPFTSANDDSFRTDARLRGRDSIMWQLSFPMQDEERAKSLCASKASLKAEALRRCGTWHAPIPELLEITDLELLSGHPVYDRPELEAEDLEARLREAGLLGAVALVGDAAHPMSPFKGQGANQALVDASALAKELAAADPSEIGEAVQRYHHDMCARTASKVRGSRAAVGLLHAPVPEPDALADLWDAGVSALSAEDLNEAVVAVRGFGHCPHALHSVKIEAAKQTQQGDVKV